MKPVLDPEQRDALGKLGIEGRMRDWTDETVRAASREALRRGRR
ncbi:MAG: hypothetical protein ACRDGR_07615 [bacterium]